MNFNSTFKQNRRKIYVSCSVLTIALVYPLFSDFDCHSQTSKYAATYNRLPYLKQRGKNEFYGVNSVDSTRRNPEISKTIY